MRVVLWLAFLACIVGIGGCASLSYITANYGSIEPRPVSTSYDTFRVFDKPDASKLMITSSLGSALAQGAGGGLLLNPTVTAVPKPVFQEAAEQYLTSTGRTCRIVDGYLLVNPQWEFRYQCDGAATASAGGAPR